MKRLAAITGMHYAFVRHFAFQGGAYGQGILSRYPITMVENIRLSLLKPDSLRQSLALIVVEVDMPDLGKVIFAGDLNATPGQPEIRLLLSQLTAASGLDQPSFPTEAPVKTIDYIFFNSRLKGKPLQSKVPPIPHSDHLPVLSIIQL